MSEDRDESDREQLVWDLEDANRRLLKMAEAMQRREDCRQTVKDLKVQLKRAEYQLKMAEEEWATVMMQERGRLKKKSP